MADIKVDAKSAEEVKSILSGDLGRRRACGQKVMCEKSHKKTDKIFGPQHQNYKKNI